MKILAERLRLLRKEKKLSQVEFAKIIGLSTNGYQRYELDERDPGPDRQAVGRGLAPAAFPPYHPFPESR